MTHLNVRDKGPRDPVAPDDPEDKAAVAAHRAALAEQAAWHEAHPDEPPVHRWHAVDARHAVEADPERYEIVPEPPGRPAHMPPPSVTERLAAIEARLDKLESGEPQPPEPQSEPQPELIA